MEGSILRALREGKGLKATYVAEKAGFSSSHLWKIEHKDEVTVSEFEAVVRAMGIMPGDLLENSIGDIKPLLPIIEVLRTIDPAALKQVRSVLESIAALPGISDGHGGEEMRTLAMQAQNLPRNVTMMKAKGKRSRRR